MNIKKWEARYAPMPSTKTNAMPMYEAMQAEIDELRAALAVQGEPVAWMNPSNGVVISAFKKAHVTPGYGYPNFSTPLYATPQPPSTHMEAMRLALVALKKTQKLLADFVANHRNPVAAETICLLLSIHDCAEMCDLIDSLEAIPGVKP